MMPSRKAPIHTSVLVLGCLVLASSHAQDPGQAQWGLGAIAGAERQAYRDFDDKAEVLPFVFYEGRRVRLVGDTLDLKLAAPESLSWSVRLRYAGDGYEAGDSPYLLGMAGRKGGFWMGGNASWQTGWATLSAELLADVSGHSKGTRLSMGVERSFNSGKFEFTPRLMVHHVDDKYVNYYHGVRAEEATSARPFHIGQASTQLEAGLRMGYALAPRHRLSLDLHTIRLGSGIKHSPLVDKTRTHGVHATYLYLF